MIAEKTDEEPLWRWAIGAVLSSYATIYFSENGFLGALILLCTLAAPRIGLVGLAGLLISLVAATVLGFERRFIRNGHYLFNSLLVSLAVAYIGWNRQLPVPSICVLLLVGSVLALLFTVALSTFMYHQMGLPPLSLPFVVVQLGLVYLAFAFSTPFAGDPSIAVPELAGLPAWLECFLRSFGSIVFLPHSTLGLAILLGVLCYSRLAILCAVVGYVAGMMTLAILPLAVGVVNPLYVAFNFLFCGMALGGAFFVPSWSSMLLTALGAAACAVVAAAEIIFFRPLGFAPLALPFNFVILTLLYALRMRSTANFLHAGSPSLRPEENFRRFRLNRARFPDAGLPTILCPFSGTRTVTQGIDGGITHRGAWRYALDFEVLEDCDGGHGGQLASSGSRLEDNLTFNTPVLSPGSGVVVKTISDVEDRSIGSSNFHNNWGNLAVIQLDAGSYVKLCHLKRNSLLVLEGQRIKAGELIGYCGNSGRSPVPHLHVQMQASPGVGATTIPFRLRHYVETRDGQRRYHSAGIPAERSRLKGASMNDSLATLFDNLAYRRYSYRIRSAAAGSEETNPAHTDSEDHIDCSVDTLGNYVFRSSTGASLTACIADKVFHTLDYAGTTGSALFYLWLSLSRVPFIDDWGVRWHDYVDARPLLSPWAAEAATLVGPFATYPLMRLSTCLEPAQHTNGDGQADLCAVCEIEQSIPRFAARFPIPARIRVAISRARWVVNIRAEAADRIVTIEQMEA